MTAEDDLATLQKRRDSLERHRVESQIRLEQETAALRKALTELKDIYGCSNLAEANEVLERLEQEFRIQVEQTAADLKAAGA